MVEMAKVFHTEALTSQFQLPLPRCETPMVLCGFVVSLQHTATALEGQSLCQLLEEIKNKAGEIGEFVRKNQKLQ